MYQYTTSVGHRELVKITISVGKKKNGRENKEELEEETESCSAIHGYAIHCNLANHARERGAVSSVQLNLLHDPTFPNKIPTIIFPLFLSIFKKSEG